MNTTRDLAIVGASLAVLGCFLPWEQQGDIVSYQTYGIRLFPEMSDNGGVLVVVLALSIVLLTFKPLRLIKNPRLWILGVSAILVAVSLVYFTEYLIDHVEQAGVTGQATLGRGLVAVIVGAFLLLWSALVNYRQMKTAGD